MHRALLLPTTALAGALALSCGDYPSATNPNANLSPALAVDRSTIAFAFVIFDEVNNLTVQVGATFEDMVNSCPGLIPPADQYELLAVTRPDGSQKFTIRGTDVHVFVWQTVANPCDLLETPHLTGTARFIAPDSDVDLTGHGADATGSTLVGTVTDDSGQVWRLLSVFHGTVSPGMTLDDFELIPHAAKTQLTPIGR